MHSASRAHAKRAVEVSQGSAGAADNAPPNVQSPGRIPHQPALDGLRGYLLLFMLCFHAELPFAVGGFLPISSFFTLSGFLITSLFLAERETTGRIDLRTFWVRRMRRLMPAALLTLALMPVFGAVFATPDQLDGLSRQIVAALFYVANWQLLLSGADYTNLFTAPSPIHHFWSLAIEEQFYVLHPIWTVSALAIGARWRGARGARLVLGCALGLGIAVSIGLSVWLSVAGHGVDRIYYGSDTRAAELLLGALAAVVLSRLDLSGRRSMLVAWLGLGALACMTWAWTWVPLSAHWLYLGGFSIHSVLSVCVIVAAVQPAGPVRRLLSQPALCWVGRVSYGGYLFHWPVFLALSPERTGLDTVPLFALRLVITFGLAGLVHRMLEAPIRGGRMLRGPSGGVAAVVAAALVLVGALVWVPAERSAARGYDPGSDVAELDAFLEGARTSDTPVAVIDPNAPPPERARERPRMSVFGDSNALYLGLALGFVLDHKWGAVTALPGLAEPGCGLIDEGRFRCRGEAKDRPRRCSPRSSWGHSREYGRPDFVVAFVGPWDVCDRLLPGHETWLAPGDAALDDVLRDKLLEAVDLLSADGALVIWLTHPEIEARGRGGRRPATPYAESDPERMAGLNAVIFEAAALRPDRMAVVDLASWMADRPQGSLDLDERPDGTHFGTEGALRVINEWLGDAVLEAYRSAADGRGQSASMQPVSQPGS